MKITLSLIVLLLSAPQITAQKTAANKQVVVNARSVKALPFELPSQTVNAI